MNAPTPPGGRQRPTQTAARRSTVDPVRVLRQHIVGILASVILGAGFGVGSWVLLNMFYPLYSSEVLFEVKPGVAESTEVGTATQLSDSEVERMARTQTELIRRRDILAEAMGSPDVRDTEWVRTWYYDEATGRPLVELAVDELEEDLGTPVLRGTNLFAIRWSAHHPNDVAVVLNAIARSYMAKRRDLDNQLFDSNEQLFERAKVVSEAKLSGRRLTFAQRAYERLLEPLLYQRVRQVFGGRLRFLVSGGAPLSEEVAKFYHACGVLVLEGYGLTETCAAIAFNSIHDFRFGSVGRPIDGADITIAEDSEILVRSPVCSSAYHKLPDATAELIDADGWMHTGDLGRFDADGFLYITGRKKNQINTRSLCHGLQTHLII